MTERDMSGALFPNDKAGNPQRPDWTGDVTIGGVKWRLAAWTKEGRRGEFLSIRVSEDRPREESRQAPQETRGGGRKAPELNDDIPFGPAKE